MNRQQKEAAVGNLAYEFGAAEAVYAVDYRGLTVAQIKDVARLYLDPQRMSVVVVEPQTTVKQKSAASAGARCENIERMVLRNGLTLIVGENSKLPLVSMRAQFLAGVPVEHVEVVVRSGGHADQVGHRQQ